MYFIKYFNQNMLKVKGWKKMYPANASQKKAEVTILSEQRK